LGAGNIADRSRSSWAEQQDPLNADMTRDSQDAESNSVDGTSPQVMLNSATLDRATSPCSSVRTDGSCGVVTAHFVSA
jgi:hypothetical protein